jgi:short-subunit dehydrogenase
VQTASHSRTAAITGASSGLGACFARKLAARDYDLLLTARRGQRLEQLRDEITAAHHVHVETCVADLSDAEALQTLAGKLSEIADLELLVNNAGFGTMGGFVGADAEAQLDMIRVHVMAPSCLTRAVLPGMLRRDRGAVINVSSLAAWLPVAGNAQYAATKSYLVVFSQALHEELRGTNVRVQALCPGFFHSGFHDAPTMTDFDKDEVPAGMWGSPEQVVDYSLKCLSKHRLIAVPGWKNRLLGFLFRSLVCKPIVRALVRSKSGRWRADPIESQG